MTRGDLARVKELVEKTPELAKVRTSRSATLLHVAARLDHEALAAYLIEKGADVDAVRDDSRASGRAVMHVLRHAGREAGLLEAEVEPVHGTLAGPDEGPAINDGKTPTFSPFIARDGSYLIFSRTHAVYTYQLFISFRRLDGSWNEARNLSEALNHPYSLNGRVTPDGKYLFFSGRNGVDYWVEASVIDALRPTASREATW